MEYPQYQPQSDNRPLSDDELNELDDLLAALPSDGSLNIEALDGYLTALLLSPVKLDQRPGADWLPWVWGGDGADRLAPFASGKQRKKVSLWVLRHLQSIACALRDHPAAWEPIFSIAAQEGGEEELVDAEDWAVGFMLAVDLDGEAWAPLFDDPLRAEMLQPLLLLGGDEAALDEAQRALLADPVQRDALGRSLPELVQALSAEQRSALSSVLG